MHTTQFVDYVHSFYGTGGIYPLSKAGKPLTKPLIKASIPLMRALMVEQGFPYGDGDGDTMDREFMRGEVFEPLGYNATTN
jgi:hypothetical protein